jgi:hypothetical protein
MGDYFVSSEGRSGNPIRNMAGDDTYINFIVCSWTHYMQMTHTYIVLLFSCVSPSLYLSLSLPLSFNLMFPETCHLLRAHVL